MEQRWFCRVGDEQRGPFSFDQLRRAAARGELKLTSLVRRADVPSWTEAGQIAELWPRAAAIPPDEPPVGKTVPAAPPPPPVAPPPAMSPPPHSAPRAAAPTPSVRPVIPSAPVVSPPPPPAVGPPVTPAPLVFAPAAPSAAGRLKAGGAKATTAKAASASAESVPAKPLTAAERRKLARRKMVLFGGAGVAALALVVVGGLVVNSMSQPATTTTGTTSPATDAAITTDPAIQPTATANSTTAAPQANGVATVPGAASVPAAAPMATNATAVAAKSAVANSPAVQQILQATKPWRNIQSSPGVSSRSMRLQITGVWLAPRTPRKAPAAQPSAGGSDIPATVATDATEGISDDKGSGGAAPEVAGTPKAASPDASGKAGSAEPQVLCVEIRVTNQDKSDATLTYASWNIASTNAAQPSLVLVDSHDKPLTIVSVDAYPDAARQSKPVRLAAKQSITDLLVFEPPSGDYEDLRLALRATAINAGETYLGFRFPKESILAERPAEVAATPAAAARLAAGNGVADAGAAADGAKEEMPAEPTPAPAAPREETIDDLKKQIAESAKTRQSEKDAARKKLDEEREKELMKEMEAEKAKGKGKP